MTIGIISMIRDAWGGSEELWYQMAKEALSKGHKVIHLGFEHPEKHPKMAELESLGMVCLKRPGWVPDTSPAMHFLHIGKNFVRKKITNPFSKLLSYKPDILLYNGTCYSIAAEKQLLKLLVLPQNFSIRFYIIGHLNHDLLRNITNSEAVVIKKAYQHCQQVLFVSQRNIDTAQRHLCTSISNAAIIKNPVNLASIELLPFSPITDTIQFAMVGNLVTVHKGQDVMLQALSQWKEANWTLNIYGKGYDLQYLKDLTHFLGLQDKVHFHGSVNDIKNIWRHNHVLLMPSHMEGMPLAVVEAMLCGRMCIATDVGGHKEWIKDGENGFIAPVASVAALLEALEKAWEKRMDWEAMGSVAYETATKLYDPVAGKTLLNRIIAE